MSARPVVLPPWAQVSEKRRGHVERVTALLDAWAEALSVPDPEAQSWHDAGVWHDALRDAPPDELRRLTPGDARPVQLLHGPAAARWLESEGERRQDVLEAIRWHTLGSPAWARTGRALYMADFLEPGRPFMRLDREFLARRVPADFDVVFRLVVRMRLEWTLREGKPVFVETAALWNQLLQGV